MYRLGGARRAWRLSSAASFGKGSPTRTGCVVLRFCNTTVTVVGTSLRRVVVASCGRRVQLTNEWEHTMRKRRLVLAVAAFLATLSLAGAVAQSAAALPYDVTIEFHGSGLCLNDPQGNTSNGVQLNVWECRGHLNQSFNLVASSTDPGYFLIKLLENPSKCVADPWASTEDGIKLEVYTCSDTPAFQWRSEPFLDGYEAFVSPYDMAFGNKDGVRKNGNPVIMWERNWGADQDWSMSA